jgi:hypothetical protein
MSLLRSLSDGLRWLSRKKQVQLDIVEAAQTAKTRVKDNEDLHR